MDMFINDSMFKTFQNFLSKRNMRNSASCHIPELLAVVKLWRLH